MSVREREREDTRQQHHFLFPYTHTHTHTSTHTHTNLIILTNRHPRHHACIRRKIQNAVPHHLRGCVDILNDQAPPAAGGGELLLDGFAFAQVFEVFFVEFDWWGPGFEGFY